MLLTIGIDPDAARELASGGVRGPGRTLIRELRERCLLTVDSTDSLSDLVAAIHTGRAAELAQVIQQLVAARRIKFPNRSGPPPVPIDRIHNARDVAGWRDFAQLLLVGEVRAAVLAEEEISAPEIAMLHEAADTEAFERLQRNWRRAAPKGKSRDKVWRESFAPLAKYTSHVYAVDGFFAVDLYRALNNPPRDGAVPGAQWLFSNLGKAGVQHVHVACSLTRVRDKHSDPDVVLQGVRGALTGPQMPELHLHPVSREFVHGRRLAFDGWAGFELHKGAASFDGYELAETMNLAASPELGVEVRKEFDELCR